MPSSVATVDATRAPARPGAAPTRAATVRVVAAPPAAREPIELAGPERGTTAPPQGEDRSVRGRGRTPDPQDQLLVQRLLAGDESALAAAYRQHAALVLRVAGRVLGNRRSAEDLTQEVFVRLWERPHDVDLRRGSLRTYLAVLTHRRAIDVLRSDSRRRSREERAHHRSTERPEDLVDTVTAGERAARVRAALDALPEAQRRAVLLAYYDGLSYRQVAVELGIPEGTAKSRLRMGLARLADLLHEDNRP